MGGPRPRPAGSVPGCPPCTLLCIWPPLVPPCLAPLPPWLLQNDSSSLPGTCGPGSIARYPQGLHGIWGVLEAAALLSPFTGPSAFLWCLLRLPFKTYILGTGLRDTDWLSYITDDVGWLNCSSVCSCWYYKKIYFLALAGVSQWIEHWVVGQVPSRMHVRGNWLMYLLHIDVSLPLSPSLPSSLKINKNFLKIHFLAIVSNTPMGWYQFDLF